MAVPAYPLSYQPSAIAPPSEATTGLVSPVHQPDEQPPVPLLVSASGSAIGSGRGSHTSFQSPPWSHKRDASGVVSAETRWAVASSELFLHEDSVEALCDAHPGLADPAVAKMLAYILTGPRRIRFGALDRAGDRRLSLSRSILATLEEKEHALRAKRYKGHSFLMTYQAVFPEFRYNRYDRDRKRPRTLRRSGAPFEALVEELSRPVARRARCSSGSARSRRSPCAPSRAAARRRASAWGR